MAKTNEGFLRKFLGFITYEKKKNDVLVFNELSVPKKVHLEEDLIVWDSTVEKIKKIPDIHLLEKFTNLVDATDTEILEFAKRWGVLGLCVHQLPASHSSFSVLEKKAHCEPIGRESISEWRDYSKILRTLLNISNRSFTPNLKNPIAWLSINKDLWLSLFADDKANIPETPQGQQQIFETSLNLWLQLAGIRPQYNFKENKTYFAYPSENTLIGELVNQLITKAGRVEEIWNCSYCGRNGTYNELAFDRLRKPRAGTRFYCDECVLQGAPQKVANQKARERNKKISNKT